MKRSVRIVLLLAVGAVAGYGVTWLGGDHAATEQPQAGPQVLYWVAPMDPNFRRDAPGKSPMGMDLVPVYAAADAAADRSADAGIRIAPGISNNLGVRTARAERGVLRPLLRSVGRLTWDEERIAHVHLRGSGWVQHLAVRSVGARVQRGDLLLEVYAPELVNAQAEFLQALRGGRTALIDAGRERLQALGVADSQLAAIQRSGQPARYVQVFAPISGVVTALNVSDGDNVQADTDIMTIADQASVWLISDVFAADLPLLQLGAEVVARPLFAPATELRGSVDYVYPELAPVTRTLRLRTRLDNADGVLRPGMFMQVEIAAAARAPAVLVPTAALIRSGAAERVIVAGDNGSFRPAAVVSGMESDHQVEILRGLAAGETVVVSGQFLIDSESSLAGATLRMLPDEPVESPGPTAEKSP